MTRGKAKKALFAALILVAVLAGIALVIPFDAPGLGRDVSESVRSATGIPLEISRSRLRLLRGLDFENVRATLGSYDIRAARLILEHRQISLLRGRWELKGVGLEGARIGSVSIGALGLELSRLDYDPRALTAIHGLSLEGILDMRDVAFEGRKLSSLSARIAAENGRFKLGGLKLLGDGGELSGDASFDFNSFPFRYRASLFGPSFEVEGVGRGKLRLEAEGFGTKPQSLKGKGAFTLEPGRFPDSPWVREIDPALAGTEHGAVEIPIEVREGRPTFQGVEIPWALFVY